MPIVQKLISAYKVWQEYFTHFPKTSRAIAFKIESNFVGIIELIAAAAYSTKREEKQTFINKAITKLDLLKFFLQVYWEIKILDNKKYVLLSKLTDEIGKMLGGWRKQLLQQTPPQSGGE